MPAVVTEMRPFGAFVTWQAERPAAITIATHYGCAWARAAIRPNWNQA